MRHKRTIWAAACLAFMGLAALVYAATPTLMKYGVRFSDEGAAHSTPPSGYLDLYVNGDTLYTITDGGTIVALSAGSGDNTLDAAYDQGGAGSGKAVTVDSGAIALSNTDADTAWLLTLNASPSSSAALGGLQITVGANATQDALEFANSGSGYDIYGTGGTWTVSKAGAISAASGTFTSLYQSAIAAAASGNANLTIDAAGTGTITLGGTSTGLITTDNAVQLYGNVDIGNAASDTLTITSIIDGNVTLDDGTTDSPSLIFKDATDQTATIAKVDADNIKVTTTAGQGLEIVTGNLIVGDGSPGTASMDGEDAYINGQIEVDGAAQFDGAVTMASTLALTGTLTGAGNVTLDDGTGASPSLTFTDATDETAIFSKADSGYLSVTTLAADGLSILTGNLKIGSGTPDGTINGEDFYVTGIAEFDGAARFDAALDINSGLDIDLATNATLVDVANAAADLAAGAGIVTVYGSNASGQSNASYLIRGAWKANGDAQDGFILFEDNSTGAAGNGDDMFKVDSGGSVTLAGSLTGSGTSALTGFVSTVIDAGGGPDTLTLADCGKTFISSEANQTNLPEASTCIGCTLTFAVMHASNFDVNPDDADLIVGATDSAGDMIRSATVGDTVTLRAVSASQWAVVSMYPASTDWTDAN